MAGDKFTLEIFADTSAAESALKRFAQNQKAIARDLAKPQTAQAKITAPQLLGGAREAGQLSRSVGIAEKQGNISRADANRYRAEIKGVVAGFKRDLASLGVKDAGEQIEKAYRSGARQVSAAFKKQVASGEQLSTEQARTASNTKKLNAEIQKQAVAAKAHADKMRQHDAKRIADSRRWASQAAAEFQTSKTVVAAQAELARQLRRRARISQIDSLPETTFARGQQNAYTLRKSDLFAGKHDVFDPEAPNHAEYQAARAGLAQAEADLAAIYKKAGFDKVSHFDVENELEAAEQQLARVIRAETVLRQRGGGGPGGQRALGTGLLALNAGPIRALPSGSGPLALNAGEANQEGARSTRENTAKEDKASDDLVRAIRSHEREERKAAGEAGGGGPRALGRGPLALGPGLLALGPGPVLNPPQYPPAVRAVTHGPIITGRPGSAELSYAGESSHEAKVRSAADAEAKARVDSRGAIVENTAATEADTKATRGLTNRKLKDAQRKLDEVRDPEYRQARADLTTEQATLRDEAAAKAARDPDRIAAATERGEAQALLTAQVKEENAASKTVTAARTRAAIGYQVQSDHMRAERAVDDRVIKSKTQLYLANQEQARRVRAAAIAEGRASGAGSLFQRGYGRLTGQDPLSAPTGGQFFGRKLATTAGYGITAAASYAVVGGIAKSIKEAEELDRVMNDITFQLDSLREREDIRFDVPSAQEVRGQILEIARTTGLAADEVGRVAFQLQGAFGGDNIRAMRETAAAAEFVRITGLSLTETVDSFTALTQSFEDGTLSAREFGDTAFGLQERFGVLADQILVFAADLAPVAAATGFTVQELQALGAAAQKFSGRTGGQLAEAFGRIIPQVQERAADFIGFFQETPGLTKFADELTNAFNAADIQGVFQILIDSYDEMSAAQQSMVVDMLGGRREAAALIGVMEGGDEVLREWNNTFNDTGKQADRFAKYNETLTQQLAKFGEQMTQIGIQIFESGFREFLEFLLDTGSAVVGVLSLMTDGFSLLNGAIPGGPGGAFEGLPGQILSIVAALKLLQMAYKSAAVGRLVGGRGGTGPGGIGAGAAFGGFFGRSAERLLVDRSAPPLIRNPYTGGFGRYQGSGEPPPGSFKAPLGAVLRDQGFTSTANTFWKNSITGLKQSLKNNTGAIAATGFIIGDQIIGSLLDEAQKSAEERGRERFVGIRAALEEGRTLTASQERDLQNAQYSTSNREQNLVSNLDTLRGIPFVGNLASLGLDALHGGEGGNAREAVEAEAEARRLMNARVASDLQVQADAIRAAGLLGVEEGMDGLSITADGETIEGEEIQRIVDKAAAGGDLNVQEQQIFDAFNGLIAAAIEGNIGRVGEILNQSEDSLEVALVTLEAVTALYQAGGASRGAYLNALTRAANGAKAQVAAGNATGEALVEAYTTIQTAAQEFSSGALASFDAASNYRTLISGESDPAAQAERFRTLITSGVLTGEDLTSGLQQYFDLRLEAQQARAEAADSVEEANAILAQRIVIPKDIRIQAVVEQLNLLDSLGTALAGLPVEVQQFFNDTETLVGEIGRLIVEEGLSVTEAFNAVIDGRFEILRTRRENYREARALIRQNIEELDNNLTGDESPNEQAILQTIRDGWVAIDEYLTGEIHDLNDAINTGVNDQKIKGGGTVQDPATIKSDQKEADQAAEDAARAVSDARFALLESLTEDPVELAQIAVERAQANLRYARASGTQADIINAEAELNIANRAARDAINDVYDSQFDLLESATEDPVELAQIALKRAQSDLARARASGDQAAINRALAAINQAHIGVRSALQEAMDAQTGLLIAIADAAGNTVRSAQLALQQAQRDLRRLRDQDAGTAAIRNARAQVISTQAGVRDALLQRRQDHYQFLYDMGRITTGQLVAYLQSLLSIPDLTRQQIRDIQLQIRNLRQELGQDFQFNLPTELALPTLFEVRRADQSGGRNFTDQRQVTVNVNVSSNVDLAALESVLASSVGTNVNGTIPRRY